MNTLTASTAYDVNGAPGALDTATRWLTVAAALGCATMAGVFFAFSTFVMAGLSRLPSAQGMAAMQSINVTAVRPAFMTGLFGSALLCIVIAVRTCLHWSGGRSLLLLAGCACYIVGTILLTMGYHVPLNDSLAALSPTDPTAAHEWSSYLRNWTAMNHVRTLSSFAAAALFTVALVTRP